MEPNDVSPYPRLGSNAEQPPSDKGSKRALLSGLAVIGSLFVLVFGWAFTQFGDHISPIEVTNRYSFPVMVELDGPKEKIMPGATYEGKAFIQGGFGCRVYDMKKKLLRELQFSSHAIDQGTQGGVFKFDVGP